MNIIQQIGSLAQESILLMQHNIKPALVIVGLLWAINLINWLLLGSRLNFLGVYPRRFSGLPGILLSHIFHGGFEHLFFNSIPLFLLLDFMLLFGMPIFISATLIIAVINGTLVWLMARPGLHIGASGVIMGYWSFLLINAIRYPSALAILIAAIMLYYLGGLIFSLFPSEESVSFEGHIFGFIGGIIAAFVCI